MLIGPMFVDAWTESGTPENAATMPPALDRNRAVGELRSVALISPASVCAVTAPASEVSVMDPAGLPTWTATPRGTSTLYVTPQIASVGQLYESVSVVPETRRVLA